MHVFNQQISFGAVRVRQDGVWSGVIADGGGLSGLEPRYVHVDYEYRVWAQWYAHRDARDTGQ